MCTDKELNEKINRYAEMKEAAANAKKIMDTLHDEIIAEMNKRNVDCISAGEHIATCKKVETNRFDKQKLVKRFPNAWQNFYSMSTTVRLTVK